MSVIGRLDRVDFPELGIQNVPVKIDTGAYSSSIHCRYITEQNEDGDRYLEFETLDPSFEAYTGQKIKAKNYKIKSVKSSNGEVEDRFFVTTTVVFFGKEESIQLSLTDRAKMKYPVLIGRRFLKNKFLVDTGLIDLSFKQKQAD